MKTYIIAEAGVNHNGNLDTAKELIAVAAKAGADAVKFQTFRAEDLVTASAPKAQYQKTNTQSDDSQFAMLKSLELAFEDYKILQDYANQLSIDFLSTPFDTKSLDFLCDVLNLPTIKISSGDLTNAPFLLDVARKANKIILSTGMATLQDIENALSVLAFGFLNPDLEPKNKDQFIEAYAHTKAEASLKEKVTILHCTTEYPAPPDEINLHAMQTMKKAFGLPVGYSDHSIGMHIPIAAVALGAEVIEKHFTLDRNLKGPDHKASMEPHELKAMVSAIREVELALGNGCKIPTPSEWKNRQIARKSLVAKEAMKVGEPLKIACKRPGSGISPFEYWALRDNLANKNYAADELLDF